MNTALRSVRTGLELFELKSSVAVLETEYRRLLGYPRNHVPGERAEELAAWARDWYAKHGRPWVYLREVSLEVTADRLQLEGMDFYSKPLQDHLRSHGAKQAVLVAVSAGRECEEHARQLWQEGKPDEYFFLEVFGSAVVEHLVANLSGRICDFAGYDGLMAVPHYSPGYTGWDVADQNRLFDLIVGGISRPFPGPIEVMSSGMLNPKKSLLAVFGLAPRTAGSSAPASATPCENCSFAPCRYRRAAFRHNPGPSAVNRIVTPISPSLDIKAALTVDAPYSVSTRALRKWAQERVRLEFRTDGNIEAKFRFDGTTCTNQGMPLAFDYTVVLSSIADNCRVLQMECHPVPGDDGYKSMCAYLKDAAGLMQSIASEKPLLGQPLNNVLNQTRGTVSSACHCSAESRAHKWSLAFEAIHFALVQTSVPAIAHSVSTPS